MKKNSRNTKQATRIAGFTAIIAFTTIIMFSYGFKKKADDLWSQLGISQQKANNNIKESFTRGFLNIYGVKNIKNVGSGNKLAVARDLLNYTKQFMNTQFKAAYEKERANAKPAEPEVNAGRTKEQIQKEEVAKLEKAIKETEASMKTLDAATQKIMQSTMDVNKKLLAEYKKPDNKMFEMMAQNEKYELESRKEDYNRDLEQWEENYPADYKQVIKNRLEQMLDITSDVDFDAATREEYGKKKFVNPNYEGKSSAWKMAFRAGKEVTGLTRAFAEQWLKELK